MKTTHLHDIWAGPDNSRLVAKQFSFRFPVHIAAKIAALNEIYPQKNRTQIVSDLLTAALDDLEKNLPETYVKASDEEQYYAEEHAKQHGYEYEPTYLLAGVRGRYRDLVNTYYKEVEKELGNESAQNLYPTLYGTEKDFLESNK